MVGPRTRAKHHPSVDILGPYVPVVTGEPYHVSQSPLKTY